MRIGSVLKWSLPSLALAGAVAIGIAVFTGQYRGQPSGHASIALVGGRVYDPASDSLFESATVVIRGREIESISASAPPPTDARTLYVAGLTVLPGLIDSHVHLSGIRSRVPDGSRELGLFSYLWKFIRRFPQRRKDLIEAGITTVKSMGDPYPWIVRLSQKIERHDLAGPRVFAAGPMLTAPGGHPVSRFRQSGQGDTSFIAQVTRQVSSLEAARAAVNQISERVDFVTAVLESRGDPPPPRLQAGFLREITATAHQRGRRVFVHVSTLRDVERALAAGADGIEHVPYDRSIDSVTLDEIRERHLFVDPTLRAVEGSLMQTTDGERAARRARENTRRLVAAGVPIVAGSDAPGLGTTFGLTLHEELRSLVEAGLSPSYAIAAATTVAAESLGQTGRLGTVAPGCWADIIAVGGDPLTDIAALSDIYLVIADGQVLLDRLSEVERPGDLIAAHRTGNDGSAQEPLR